jgi:hyperosmotically inducible protein
MKLTLTGSMLLSGLFLLTSQVYAATATTTTDSSAVNNSTVTSNDVVASTPEEDAAITKTLTNLIKNSKTLSHLNVKFTVNNGIVSYTGTLDSDSQAGMLIETAESIIGVSDVDTSNLKVTDSEQPFADMVTTAKIKGLLIREDLFGEKDLASINTSVETHNGVVYLTGIVDNEQQIQNAVQIIKSSVPDVKKVVYNVRKAAPTTTDDSQTQVNQNQ